MFLQLVQGLDTLYGEMVQVIEWLIFGHIVKLSTRYVGMLIVYFWGSNTRIETPNTSAATRMLAVARIAAAALRKFLANVALE